MDEEFSEYWFNTITEIFNCLKIENVSIYQECLCGNPNLTLRLFEKLEIKNVNIGSKNLSINWNYIKKDLESKNPKIWNFKLLALSPNITWEIVRDNPSYPWSYDYLSQNPNITWEIVKDNLDKAWDFTYGLSCNPNITWEIVRDNPSYPWGYDFLSKNPNITWEIVRDNPSYPWDIRMLSCNPNITWEIVRDNPSYPWDFIYGLTQNPNITWEIVRDNPSYPWDYYILSQNSNITWDNIQQKSDLKSINWYFSSNQNLDLDMVLSDIKNNEKNISKWNFLSICLNGVPKWKEKFIKERQHKRCSLIKDELLYVTHHPSWYFLNCRDIIEISEDFYKLDDYKINLKNSDFSFKEITLKFS